MTPRVEKIIVAACALVMLFIAASALYAGWYGEPPARINRGTILFPSDR